MENPIMEFLTKLKSKVFSILSVIGGIALFLLFGWWALKKPSEADKALAQNEEDKKKLADLDTKIDNNNKLLAEEERKREELKKSLEKEIKDVSKDALADYFNDPDNKPS